MKRRAKARKRFKLEEFFERNIKMFDSKIKPHKIYKQGNTDLI